MLKGTPTVKVDPKAVLVRQVPADAATQPTSRPGSPELPRPAPDAGKPTPAGDPAGRADTAKLMDVYEARVYKDSQGRSLNYRLLKALNYDPKTRYPLVLFMHGKGASQGQDNKAQITAPGVMPAVTLFADPQVRQRFPAFVIVPQAPRELWVADGVIRSLAQTEKPTLTLQLVVEAMDALQKEFSIDTDRIYVTGTSYGGFGTWDLITRYPDKYAAAMPMAGGGDESKASLIAKLPIWNFHGAKDPVVPVDRSRRMIAAIEKTGGKPKYTEYPTAAHADAWGKAFAEKDLLEWLFAQKRSSAK
jgi:predicted peptidase